MCGGTVSAGILLGCELETGSLPYSESGGFSLCELLTNSQHGLMNEVRCVRALDHSERYHKYK